MSRRKRYSPEEKLRIVLMGLKGEKRVSELCREFGISDVIYYKWRDKFIEGGKAALENGPVREGKSKVELENEELKKALSDLLMENRLLKKLSGK